MMFEELPARMDRLESQILQLRAENSEEHSALRREVADLGARMQQLQEDQKTHTGVLFEEALSRIAAMNEGRTASRKQKR
jgi:CHASE3 domain sensor protein